MHAMASLVQDLICCGRSKKIVHQPRPRAGETSAAMTIRQFRATTVGELPTVVRLLSALRHGTYTKGDTVIQGWMNASGTVTKDCAGPDVVVTVSSGLFVDDKAVALLGLNLSPDHILAGVRVTQEHGASGFVVCGCGSNLLVMPHNRSKHHEFTKSLPVRINRSFVGKPEAIAFFSDAIVSGLRSSSCTVGHVIYQKCCGAYGVIQAIVSSGDVLVRMDRGCFENSKEMSIDNVVIGAPCSVLSLQVHVRGIWCGVPTAVQLPASTTDEEILKEVGCGVTLNNLGIGLGTDAVTGKGLQYHLEKSWGIDYHLNFTIFDTVDTFVRPMAPVSSYAAIYGVSKELPRTIILAHWNSNFSEFMDCLKFAAQLYQLAEPFWMDFLSLSLLSLDYVSVFNRLKGRGCEELVMEQGCVEQVLIIHCSNAKPVFSYAWNVKIFGLAYLQGIPIRQVGFSRVLREELARVNARSSIMSVPEHERGVHKSFVDSVGGYDAVDELIRKSIQETLDAFSVRSKQHGCGPELWGMSVAQLRSARASMIAEFPEEYRTRTMACMVEQFVKPRTAGTGRGWALLQNSETPLSPHYLISHAWSENFDEFVEAIFRSQLKEDDVIWICAFALYQNQDGHGPSIADQLGLDVKEGPFSRILSTPTLKGLIGVHTSSGDLYTRLWCILELSDAAEHGVSISFAGDPEVIAHQLRQPADSVNAVCGPVGLPYMVDDTRKIRSLLERAWGIASTTLVTGTGKNAYETLNDIIRARRAAMTGFPVDVEDEATINKLFMNCADSV